MDWLKWNFNKWNKKKCPKCRCNKIRLETKAWVGSFVAEEAIYCMKCGTPVNYWAYGHYQFPETKTKYIRFIWEKKDWKLSWKLKQIIRELLF